MLDRLWADWRSRYVNEVAGREDTCFLCALASLPDSEAISDRTLVLERTALTISVMNLYPYGSGHLMVAPRRHVGALDALSDDELVALALGQQRAVIAIKGAYDSDGINLGANLGRAAGAGVPDHLHVHVLPRWSGDTNFMTSVAETRVLSESLADGWRKLHAAWPEVPA